MSDGLLPERLADCSPGTRLVFLSVRHNQPIATGEIAADAHLSEPTVRRALKELRERDEVRSLPGRDGRRRFWRTTDRARVVNVET